MPAKKDYVGEMFGQLKVVECLEPSTGKNNGGFYRCECSCGTSINVYGYKLHWRKSCGCLEAESKKVNGLKNRKPQTVTIGAEYLIYKNNALQAKRTPLPKDIWLSIASQPCYYCGEIDKRNRATMNSYKRNCGVTLTDDVIKLYEVEINGIDRIDSLKGYEVENCVPCCGVCNRMKNSFTQKQFFEKVKLIYNKHYK